MFYKICLIGKSDAGISFSKFSHEKINAIEVFGNSELKFDIRKMLTADLVITCGEWYEDDNCKKAVLIARTCNMEVINELQFKNYVEQNYN